MMVSILKGCHAFWHPSIGVRIYWVVTGGLRPPATFGHASGVNTRPLMQAVLTCLAAPCTWFLPPPCLLLHHSLSARWYRTTVSQLQKLCRPVAPNSQDVEVVKLGFRNNW